MPLCYLAVGRLLDVLVNGDAADVVGDDGACAGIFDFCYRADDGCVDVGILEDAVAVSTESAVLKHQLLGIAQRLLTSDVASYESHVL